MSFIVTGVDGIINAGGTFLGSFAKHEVDAKDNFTWFGRLWNHIMTAATCRSSLTDREINQLDGAQKTAAQKEVADCRENFKPLGAVLAAGVLLTLAYTAHAAANKALKNVPLFPYKGAKFMTKMGYGSAFAAITYIALQNWSQTTNGTVTTAPEDGCGGNC